ERARPGGPQGLGRPDPGRCRDHPPDPPRQARPCGHRPRPLGPDPRGRLRGVGDPLSERHGDHRRARDAHLRRRREAHQRSRQRVREEGHQGGRRGRDHVPQPPRLRRRDRRVLEARGARALPEHHVRGPADHGRGQARGPRRDRLRRGVLQARQGRRQGPQALHRLVRRARQARLRHHRGAHRAGRHDRPEPAEGEGPRRHPHQRDDRHAEGRQPQAARVARSRRRALQQDPAQGARAHDDRRAAVPLVGLRALHARPRPEQHDRPAPQVRPRDDAERHRAARVHEPRGRPGDAPAHPRARRGDDQEVRPVEPPGHRSQRQRAAGRARGQGHGRVRRRALQPLRVDRGGVGDDRYAEGPARRPRHRRAPAARDDGQALRRGGQGGRAGRDRPDLRRQRDALRGLHRRREQGLDRRPHVDRRRRSLRRGRPAVRRRPRRRDDRLGRRERVPPRSRGSARRPQGHRRGRGHRRRRREVRPGPQGVRRDEGLAERGRDQEVRQGEPGELQGPQAHRVPRRVASQRDRQDPQARAQGRGRRRRRGRQEGRL
ncbi:MAG: Long-chain-fatty-acid--CoA ligase, partial [uncultured Solirubrobacteraceae bacterium]